jgi:hypothetical protein
MTGEEAAGGRPRPAFWLVFLILFGVGAWLRLHAIAGQIVADDEIHSLAVAGRAPAWWIATHFLRADASTPLALLQLVIGRAVGLSELTARLPVLVAGALALVALPLLARREAGDAVALAFLGLLAISPQLVFYSRFGRPYMVSTLLVGLGLFAFLRWWRSGSRGGAWAYVLCAAAASWFSLPALPAALTPLAGAGLLAAAGSRQAPRSGLRGVVLVGVALAALLTALLLPPSLTSAAAIADKVGGGAPGATTLGNVLLLYAGTGEPWLAALFWILVAIGTIFGARRRPLLAALAGASILVEVAAVAIVAPAWANLAPVAARYASCILPWVLLLQAFAFAEPAGRSGGGAAVGLVGAGVMAWLALLLAFGPLPVSYGRSNNLTNHPAYEYRYEAPLPTGYPTIPRFYCLIGRDPEHFAIVETPWYSEWFSNFFAHYQHVHGKEIYIGFRRPPPPWNKRLAYWPFGAPYAFRRFVDLDDPDALSGLGVRYVVVHKDLRREMWNDRVPYTGPRFDTGALRAELRKRYHRWPAYEDGRLAVYRIDGRPQPPWNDPACLPPELISGSRTP